jgi:hypothetical protein
VVELDCLRTGSQRAPKGSAQTTAGEDGRGNDHERHPGAEDEKEGLRRGEDPGEGKKGGSEQRRNAVDQQRRC